MNSDSVSRGGYARMAMEKVLLLSMPFGALDRPALGLSMLKACLARESVACDICYPSFTFAEFIGYEDYQWTAAALPYTAFAGEWTFTESLYGERPAADARYFDEVLRTTWRLDELAIRRLLHVRSFARPFLDYCLAAISWADYAIVGFTSTFEQNLASLALAQRVKMAHPQIAVVFGGANWEGEMGQELHYRFPFVDYVCSGEAEVSFPALVAHVLAREPNEIWANTVPGIVYRFGNKSCSTGQAALIRQLDRLPYPDYADYFGTLAQSTVGASVMPNLLVETSRGCWWGAKSHCTFCGLNGGTLAFRSKSAARARAEIEYLMERWRLDMVEVVDNILDMRYFDDLLPALAHAPLKPRLFYEVKANLSRCQVRALRDAGVYRIQPGLESMSDHVLRLMRKGTTALRNVQLLKWCKEYGVAVDWNILYGVPGETRDDYAKMLDRLLSIRFLPPPTGYGPVRLDRFSPYFEAPSTFGFTQVRPMTPYRYLYPFPPDSLDRIAYYFDYEYDPGVDPTGFADEVITFIQAWQRTPESGLLSCTLRPDGSLVLIDTRTDAVLPHLVLTGLEQAAYQYCDSLHSVSSVSRYLRETFVDARISDGRVRAFLDSLVANRLMVTDGDHYLSLAIGASSVSPQVEQETATAMFGVRRSA